MKFTKDIELRYIGTIDQAYLAYASDEQVRLGAASGGVVSAVLLYLLDKHQIDAAVVTRVRCSAEGMTCDVVLASDREGVLSSRTSKYIDVPLARKARQLIKESGKNVAVVALPCHTTILRRLMEKDAELACRIKYIITLFCGHSCKDYLLNSVLRKNGIEPTELEEFYFRRGHWRGSMQGKIRGGSEFSFPFNRFSYYHNLNFFCLGRCLACYDHTGYESDFSVGDAWLREMKGEPIKHSIVITRNKTATGIIEGMMKQGNLAGRQIDAETIFRAQKRALIYHYNVTARSKVGKRYGINIKDKVGAKVRWNDWLAAHVIMINHRLSCSERSRDWIFRVPRPIIFLYFLFLKFLQNF